MLRCRGQRGDAEMKYRCRGRDVEVQRCRCAEVQRGPERCRVEMERCGIGVEMFRCRGAEVEKVAEW